MNQLKEGKIHLSQITKLQKAARLARKLTGQSVSSELKKEVLEKLEGKSSFETDLILAREFKTPVSNLTHLTVQQDESVRVEITFTKEEYQLIKEVQAHMSHKTGGGLKDLFLHLVNSAIVSNGLNPSKSKSAATMAVGKYDQGQEAELPGPCAKAQQMNKKENAEFGDAVNKSITPALRRSIIGRDQCCQYRDPKTGKQCGSKYFLDVDHILPRHRNGSNAATNLRALCRNHNIYRYEVEVGKIHRSQ